VSVSLVRVQTPAMDQTKEPNQQLSNGSLEQKTATRYQIVIVGDEKVGKSSLKRMFVDGNRKTTVSEFGKEEVKAKQIEVDGEACVLNIRDVGVGDKIAKDAIIQNGQGFLVVYSVLQRASFESVTRWRKEVLQLKEEVQVPLDFDDELVSEKRFPELPIIIIGNKSDLSTERQVAATEGEDLAKKLMCPFF